jgi:hypothetical protein
LWNITDGAIGPVIVTLRYWFLVGSNLPVLSDRELNSVVETQGNKGMYRRSFSCTNDQNHN